MSTQHTPGYWACDIEPNDEGQVFVYPASQSDETRVDICNVTAWYGDATRDANARLIAAAPELLEVAETALSAILTAEELEGLDQEMFAETKDALRAAIAKARGET